MKTRTKTRTIPKTPFFAAFAVGAVLFSAHAGGGFATGNQANTYYVGLHDFIDYWNCRNANCLDFLDFPVSPFSEYLVPILSGVLDSDDSHAGHLLFYRSEERPCGHENAVKGFCKIIIMLPVR